MSLRHLWHGILTWPQKTWHQFWCWRGIHVMILYQVGHNFGRECRWCRVHGMLSRDDLRRLFGDNDRSFQ
jgi:hypothetical protein